jgi:hypothetical protein
VKAKSAAKSEARKPTWCHPSGKKTAAIRIDSGRGFRGFDAAAKRVNPCLEPGIVPQILCECHIGGSPLMLAWMNFDEFQIHGQFPLLLSHARELPENGSA